MICDGHKYAQLSEGGTGVVCSVCVKDDRIYRLEAALKEIAKHPHCTDSKSCRAGRDFDPVDDPLYHSGKLWGHRCAAEIARKALEP